MRLSRIDSRRQQIETRIRKGDDPPKAYQVVYGFWPRGRDTWVWLCDMYLGIIEEDDER
jgi:hypothetical protein